MVGLDISLLLSSDPHLEMARDFSFLSSSRNQAFDLLLHLSAHLSQPIALCGPEGIGKTSYLRLLEDQVGGYASVCHLVPVPGLLLERILYELQQTASQDLRRTHQLGTARVELADLLTAYDKGQRTLILLLDGAEALLPGLLSALWQYARLYSALKIIFTLRPEDLQQKLATDALVMGDAFVLDIPPLSRTESDAYVKERAEKTSGPWVPEALTPERLADIYEKTSGVPGLIEKLLQQPLPESRKTIVIPPRASAAGAAVLLLSLAGGFIYWGHRTDSSLEPAEGAAGNHLPHEMPVGKLSLAPEPHSASKLEPTSPSSSVVQAPDSHAKTDRPEDISRTLSEKAATPIERPQLELPPVSSLAERPDEKRDNPDLLAAGTHSEPQLPADEVGQAVMPTVKQPRGSATEPESLLPLSEPIEAKTDQAHPGEVSSAIADSMSPAPTGPMMPEATHPNSPQSSSPLVDSGRARVKDESWLMAQNPESYTLQIIAVEKANLLEEIATRFPADRELASFYSQKGKRHWFRLYHGIYPDLAAAKAAASTLPKNFKNPLIRQLKTVQREIEKAGALRTPRANSSLPSPPSEPQISMAEVSALVSGQPKEHGNDGALGSEPSGGGSPVREKEATSGFIEGREGPKAVQPEIDSATQAIAKPVLPTVSGSSPAIKPAIAVSRVKKSRVVTAPRRRSLTSWQGRGGSPANLPSEPAAMANREPLTAPPVAEVMAAHSAPVPAPAPPSPDAKASTQLPTSHSGIGGVLGVEWLLAQHPQAYTLQIVAVSQLSSIARLARRFPAGSILATYRSPQRRGDLFPLFYGIFSNLAAAKLAGAQLSLGLGAPMPRQLKTIQREIGQAILSRKNRILP
jgi:septal ring-binding cell division protein DamX/type II secretory pathway predicted ATPase ExeA